MCCSAPQRTGIGGGRTTTRNGPTEIEMLSSVVPTADEWNRSMEGQLERAQSVNCRVYFY